MSVTDRELFKDHVFLEMAVTLGSLGTCNRAQVGCIVTRDGRAVSWGYNGSPPGMPHCPRRAHETNECLATHAETNALAFAARQGISTDAATLYVERSPCDGCARLCIAAGIARVVYLTPYRDESGVTMLHEAEVKVQCLS